MRQKSAALFLPLLLWFLSTACDANPYRQGEILYQNFCANCHMEGGNGLGQLIPPLAGADWLAANQAELPCLIRYGMNRKIIVNGQAYQQPMPGEPRLSDFEIANIINYINHAWGNDLGYYQFEWVAKAFEGCAE